MVARRHAHMLIAVVVGVALVASLPTPAFAASRTFLPATGNWNDPANWSGGLVPGPGDTATIGGGKTVTVDATPAASPDAVELSGSTISVVSGATLTVSNSMTIISGTLRGPGAVTLASGSTLSINGLTLNTGVDLTVGTTTTWSAGVIGVTGDAAAITSLVVPAGASFALLDDGSINSNTSEASARIVNNGTITKGGSALTRVNPRFVNHGTVGVAGGTLQIGGGPPLNESHTGDFSADAGATLTLLGVAQHLADGASFSGDGVIQYPGGTIAAGVTIPIENLTVFGTIASGAGTTLSVSESLNLVSGASLGGPGTTDFAPGSALSIAGGQLGLLGGFDLVLPPGNETTWASGSIHMAGSDPAITSIVVPTGSTFPLRDGGSIGSNTTGDSARVVNNGTITKAGPGSFSLAPRFLNEGDVDVTAGTLTLGSGPPVGQNHTGDFATAAEASLTLAGGAQHLGDGASFSGEGPVTYAGGTIAAGATIPVETLRLFGATTFPAGSTFSVGHALDLVGGTVLSGPSSIAFGPGTTLSINTNGQLLFSNGFDLELPPGNGTTWASGSIRIVGGAGEITSLVVPSGATFPLRDGGGISTNTSSDLARVVNDGTIEKDGVGTTSIAPVVFNHGQVDVLTGTLLAGTTRQDSGQIDISAGATLQGSAFLDGGSLVGRGSVLGSVQNGGGTVSPGKANAHGSLSIASYQQNAGGTLEIDINGTALGSGGSTGYDRLAVTNNASLSGTLAIVNDPAFAPALADVFTVLTRGSGSGTFTTLTGAATPAGTYEPTYTTTAVELRVGANANQRPEPVDDTVTVDEDSADNPIDVLANDSDPDGDVLTSALDAQPLHGTADCTADACTYTPDADFNGSDEFTYHAADPQGLAEVATVSVTVAPVNDDPDAADDTADVTQNSVNNQVDVLANDDDLDGDTVQVSDVTDPDHGNAAVGSGGTSVLYTPETGFTGNDSFTYTISDGNGGTDTASVSVTVTGGTIEVVLDAQPNDAQDFRFHIEGGGPDFDLDDDGDGALPNSRLVGPLQVAPGGTDYFVVVAEPFPAGWRVDKIECTEPAVANPAAREVEIDLDSGDSVRCTFTIVAGFIEVALDAQPNDAQDFDFQVSGVSTSINLDDNDDGKLPNSMLVGPLPVNSNGIDYFVSTVGSLPAGWRVDKINCNGSVVDDGSNEIRVTLKPGDRVLCTFTIVTGFLEVELDAQPNDPQDFRFFVPGQGSSFNLDDDDDVTLPRSRTLGPLPVAGGGTDYFVVVLDPFPAFWAVESIDCTEPALDDPAARQVRVDLDPGDRVRCTFEIVRSNRPPDAVDDSVTVDGDSAGNSIPVLANDGDIDNDPVLVDSATDPPDGTVQVFLDGSGLSYTPNTDFVGTDSFDYTIDDGRGGQDTATVTVTVRPANDDFADAEEITLDTGDITGTTRLATREPNEPLLEAPHCSETQDLAEGTVWYRWIPDEGGIADLAVINATCGAVFTGDDLSDLTLLTSFGQLGQGESVEVTAGTTYYLRVAGTGGEFTINRFFTPRPANDDFANAEVVADDTSDVDGTLRAATREPDEPFVTSLPCIDFPGSSDRTVWYEWTPSRGGFAELSLDGSGCGAVFSGDGLNDLSLHGTFGAFGGNFETFEVTDDTTYYLRVAGTGGELTIRRTFTPRPANDDFADAEQVTDDTSDVDGTLRAATREPNEPFVTSGTCIDSPGSSDRTVWYEWTPSRGGFAHLALSGGCGALFTGASLADLTLHGTFGSAFQEIEVTDGTTYYLRAAGESGTFTIMRMFEPRPTNDDFVDAEVVADDTSDIDGTLRAATREPNEPFVTSGTCIDFPGSSDRTVWYEWTPSIDGVAGLGGVSCGAVFTGDALSDLALLGTFGSAFERLEVTAGTTYYLRVAGNGGQFRILRTLDLGPPVIDPHADITREASGPDGRRVAYVMPEAFDDVDGLVEVDCSPPSESLFPIGTTTVECSAQDSLGNVATSTFDIIVRDTIAPFITVPDDITVEATQTGGAIVNFVAQTFDAADGITPADCTPASGSLFPAGAGGGNATTTVTCGKTDAHGNVGTPDSFTITVVGADAQLAGLKNSVDGARAEAGLKSSLSNHLKFVVNQMDNPSPNLKVACQKLDQFIAQVQKESSKNNASIDVATAQAWIEDGQQIKSVIGC